MTKKSKKDVQKRKKEEEKRNDDDDIRNEIEFAVSVGIVRLPSPPSVRFPFWGGGTFQAGSVLLDN